MEFLWQRHLVEENATDKKSKNIWCFCVCVLSLCIQSRFCVCETHCVRVWLMQPLVSRVHSLQGALDLCSSFCSAAQRVCDLERVGHTHRERLDSYTVLQYCLLLYGSENSYEGAAFSSADINKPPKHPWTCCFQVCSCYECRETERERMRLNPNCRLHGCVLPMKPRVSTASPQESRQTFCDKPQSSSCCEDFRSVLTCPLTNTSWRRQVTWAGVTEAGESSDPRG